MVQEGLLVASLYRITVEVFAAHVPEGDEVTVPFYTLRADRVDGVVADAFAYGPLIIFAVVGRFDVLGVDGGQR